MALPRLKAAGVEVIFSEVQLYGVGIKRGADLAPHARRVPAKRTRL